MEGAGKVSLLGRQGEEGPRWRLLGNTICVMPSRGEWETGYSRSRNGKSKNEVVGFEALLRWEHASAGDIQPSIFISDREESEPFAERRMGPAHSHVGRGGLDASPDRCGERVGRTKKKLHNVSFPHLVHEILLRPAMRPGRWSSKSPKRRSPATRPRNRDDAPGSRRGAAHLPWRFGNWLLVLVKLRTFRRQDQGRWLVVRSIDNTSQASRRSARQSWSRPWSRAASSGRGVETEAENAVLMDEAATKLQGFPSGGMPYRDNSAL